MRGFLLAVLATTLLGAQDLKKLPEWARPHAEAAAQEAPPAEADAWVLLDRTEVAYAGNGEVLTRKLRLVKVLTDRGRGEGSYVLSGLGGQASKIKKLKGWNLRPQGELVKLDRDSVITADEDFFSDEVSTGTRTHVALDQVEKGSLIAFESLESFRHPMGPSDGESVMEQHPVRRFEIELARKEGWFSASLANVQIRMDLRHFEPWIKAAQVEQKAGQSLVVRGIPALPKNEGAHPHGRNVLPWVMIRFFDPLLSGGMSQDSWDSLAMDTARRYEPFLDSKAVDPVPVSGANLKERLQSLHAWMAKEISYRAVYLSPERGWVPERPAEVMRKRFGDCKDMATFLLTQARKEGIVGSPVLARIVEGTIDSDEPSANFAFNHVIAALKLEKPLGLPSEFETPRGHFLLVDPTSPLTPLGYLPGSHRGRRVLICTLGGGTWVEIPPSACPEEEVAYHLTAKVDLKGDLEGEFRIVEQGNLLGMRHLGFTQGKAKLKEFVLRALEDLPPTGSLELVDASDPARLDQPYEVRLKLKFPQGFRRSGEEYALMPWGAVRVPGTIQKPGLPRQFPVSAGRNQKFRFHAEVEVPWAMAPLLPEARVQSPWRDGTWKAEATSAAGATRLVLDYAETRKGAYFDFEHREAGVEAWKKDRNSVRRVRQDGLVFRAKP